MSEMAETIKFFEQHGYRKAKVLSGRHDPVLMFKEAKDNEIIKIVVYKNGKWEIVQGG